MEELREVLNMSLHWLMSSDLLGVHYAGPYVVTYQQCS